MAQKLILFEDIINGKALKSNTALMAELEKLADYVFGESGYSIEKAEATADDIQIWSGDELYKALINDYGTAFRFKASFDIQKEGYAGPVMAWCFEPDGAFDDQIVVLTCESNGLFKNPRYVCGLLISEYDLERQFGDLGGNEDDEDDDEDEDGGCKIVNGKCVIPDGVTKIPYDLVNGNKELEEVDIPGSVEAINDDTFSWCSHLVSVKLHDGLKKIGEDAFLGCRSLKNINLPNTLARIGDTAFSGCRNLEQLVIPDSVRYIGEDAFEECDSLERIYIRNADLLEDSGLDDDVEIITEFEDKDILPPAQRTPREYIFQYPIKATVGQAVRDLKQIVKEKPDGYLSCSDPFGNGGDYYVTGIKEWEGIVILKCNCAEDDAISAESLLDELSDFDEDAGLILALGFGWELRNLYPEDDGMVFLCEEGDTFFRFEDHDIRLFSAKDLSHLFSGFAEKYPDRKVFCKAKDGSFYPVAEVFDDDGIYYIAVRKGKEAISASDFKESFDDSEGGVVVKFLPSKSYSAIYAKKDPVFFEDKVDGEDVIAFRLGETLCDTRIEDPYDDCDIVRDEDTLVTVDDLCDNRLEEWSDEKLKDVVHKAIASLKQEKEAEIVTKSDEGDKGDVTLKLVSYSGSVIKMMTALSGIDGIDEDAAFNILQKLPAVVREGISAKMAMKIGAILEEAGATVELASASSPVAKADSPKSAPKPVTKPAPAKAKPEPKPKKAPVKKQTGKDDKLLIGQSNGHDFVDLGLPSGLKWATCNVGASTPEEFGDYFAWGEVQTKRSYSLDNYKVKGYHNFQIDECLSLEDDAAHAQWGGKWRMPTIAEFKELDKYCVSEKTVLNGVTGFRFKSKENGKSIFLPGAGCYDDKFDASDLRGFYWSSSRCDKDYVNFNRMLHDASGPQKNTNYGWAFCTEYWGGRQMNWDDCNRYCGFSIRPVTK